MPAAALLFREKDFRKRRDPGKSAVRLPRDAGSRGGRAGEGEQRSGNFLREKGTHNHKSKTHNENNT